jgi:signal transduction histidine kinase
MRSPTHMQSMAELTPREQNQLTSMQIRRRGQVLRIIVPGLFVFVLIFISFFLFIPDKYRVTPNIFLWSQIVLGAVFFIIAFWATWAKYTRLASLMVIGGSFICVLLTVLNNGLPDGMLDIRTISMLYLFIIPLSAAGVLTDLFVVISTEIVSLTATILIIVLFPPSPALTESLQTPGNVILIVLPIFVQFGVGFLVFAGTYGARFMQDELAYLRVAYDRKRELERLREQFISSVNHEMRTPIMALQGYITLARELGKQGDIPSQNHMLQRGQEVADNLSTLVKSMLNIRRVRAQGQDMNMEELQVKEIVDHVTHLTDLLNVTQKQMNVVTQIPADLTVQADNEALREVLSNLISNAFKYAPENTTIRIDARILAANMSSEYRRPLKKEMVEITVRDQGPGIPPDRIPFIFEPFVRLERDEVSTVLGSGLGLAICRTHVEAMSGQIWAESTGIEDEGVIFHVLLLPGIKISAPVNSTKEVSV